MLDSDAFLKFEFLCQLASSHLQAQLEKKSGRRKKKRRRRRGGEAGDDGGTEDDEDDEDDDGEDEDGEEESGPQGDKPDYWREQQEKLEKEKKAILEDHSLVADEKKRLLKQKERKMDDLSREKEASELLGAKIKVTDRLVLFTCDISFRINIPVIPL